jgi:hypothetical protein
MGLFDQELKRMNFFRGFLTTEKDWNESEEYHQKKRMLHNAYLHGPGVVPHFKGGLEVRSRGKGELAVEVAPGYAIDGQGHDLILFEPVIKTINPGDFKLPGAVYVVIRYVEEFDDFVSYKENPEYKGHRRIAERVKVEVTMLEPDVDKEIELGRIQLTPDAKKIVEAKVPTDPRDDEIDRRFVPLAGSMGGYMSPSLRLGIGQFLKNSKIAFSGLYHEHNITPAADVLHGLITTEMLLNSNFIDSNNIFQIMASLLELQWDMIDYVERTMPKFSRKEEFANFKQNIRKLRGRFSEERTDMGALNEFVQGQEGGFDAMKSLFKERIRTKEAGAEEIVVTPGLMEKASVLSGDMSGPVEVGNILFGVVDTIDFVNKSSEASHEVNFAGHTHKYRSRQKLKYPDGTELEDVGAAITGGELTYKIRGVKKDADLLLLTRIDYVYGDWEQDIYVNDKKVGSSKCTGVDRKFRWRNWPYLIPRQYITDDELVIRQVAMSVDRDINFFRIWALQKEE